MTIARLGVELAKGGAFLEKQRVGQVAGRLVAIRQTSQPSNSFSFPVTAALLLLSTT
jgi:hypothetical protein